MAATVVADDQQSYWQTQLERAKKMTRTFWDNGDAVVDAYRLQKSDGNDALSKDKYNILYSSTETIRPNLYGQTPVPRCDLRNKDTASDAARLGAMLLEGCLKYIIQEEDFDEIMNAAVEDFLLPGMGTGWVTYEATFADKTDADGNKIPMQGGKKDEYEQELLDEMVKMYYVYWQDMLFGTARTWKEMPWVARRCWMTKDEATKRFGAVLAAKLKYAAHDSTARERDNPAETAEVWEIWDKRTRKVFWYAENMPSLLDSKDDPLKLKAFFPCPRPLRAISNTRTFIPRALYSQYKSQAETLNVLTKRIRLLGEALRVVGLYDGSQQKLADVLNPSAGNRMIAVDSWALFAQNGGINGSVQWVPIDAVVKSLNELLKAREVCKQEIYEITGFSDIVRGVSKASETLGAQNIKADWAGARVKKMQNEVQRFARDLLSLAGELIAEHCSPTTIAVFSGVQIPTPEEVQSNPQTQGKVQLFMQACELIKSDIRRVSVIDIETDSTLMANDQAEREDRAKFMASAGAFLQQAVPAMEAKPELGPLLGAMLMFGVRTFPSSRTIEDEFEKVQQMLAQAPPAHDQKASDAAGKAADAQNKAQELQIRGAEAQSKSQYEQGKLALEDRAEQNRHAEKMAELQLKAQELQIRERELAVKEDLAKTERFTAMHNAGLKELTLDMDHSTSHTEIEQAAAQAAADRQHEADQADLDREHEAQEGEADRASQEAATAAQIEAGQASEPSEGSGEG